MQQHSIEPSTRKFVSFARKYKKQLLDWGLDFLKTAFKQSSQLNQSRWILGTKIADDDKIEK